MMRRNFRLATVRSLFWIIITISCAKLKVSNPTLDHMRYHPAMCPCVLALQSMASMEEWVTLTIACRNVNTGELGTLPCRLFSSGALGISASSDVDYDDEYSEGERRKTQLFTQVQPSKDKSPTSCLSDLVLISGGFEYKWWSSLIRLRRIYNF